MYLTGAVLTREERTAQATNRRGRRAMQSDQPSAGARRRQLLGCEVLGRQAAFVLGQVVQVHALQVGY